MKTSIRSLSLVLAMAAGFGAASSGPALAAGNGHELKHRDWSFQGGAKDFFGTFDQAQLQRGYQIYKEVCAACHSLDLLSYRNLGDPHGPGFSEAEVEVLASQAQVPAGPDDYGEILDEEGFLRMRPALPSDRFANPYPNEEAARAANGGTLPPDLSVITKARHDGVNYVYSLMTGFVEAPQCFEGATGYYNKYFTAGLVPDACKDEEGNATVEGSMIVMAPPLLEGTAMYEDGTEATVDQMSADVAAFLAWAAEPHMEARKQMGVNVIIYLVILSIFLYLSYRRVWRDIEH